MKFTPEQQLKEIKKGTVDLIDENVLLARLTKSFKEKKPLTVKFGVDPTAPDIHLGHTVPLNKLKLFQDFGHKIIFLIGDFTARIGDPSGRSATRPPLSREDVEANAKTYVNQVGAILDKSKIEIRFNSEWLDKMSASDIVKLTAQYTVARILERDDFSKRFQSNKPISIHEFLYPLMQGYDSVALKADIELGGTDQKFNLLVGRELQKSYGGEPQVVITCPLLVGLDGVQKMSKSLNNYIGIEDAPNDIFGKVMSISDDLMMSYYELLSYVPSDEYQSLKKNIANGSLNPKDAKVKLALELVERFYDKAAASEAQQAFESLFKRNEIPEDIEVFSLKGDEKEIWLPKLLALSGVVSSTSEGRRMIKSNAVSIDGSKQSDQDIKIPCMGEIVIKVGKRRFVKVRFS